MDNIYPKNEFLTTKYLGDIILPFRALIEAKKFNLCLTVNQILSLYNCHDKPIRNYQTLDKFIEWYGVRIKISLIEDTNYELLYKI